MVESTRGERSEMFFLRRHLQAPRVDEYGKSDTEEIRRDSSRCTKVQKKARRSGIRDILILESGRQVTQMKTLENMGK